MIRILLPAILALMIYNPINVAHSPADEFSPSWSPDGSQLSYLRVTDSPPAEIYLLAQSTGSVTNFPHRDGSDLSPVWSPDGKQIAYSNIAPSSNHLVVSDSDGNHPQILVTFPERYYIGSVTWSPDGSKIAFVSGYALYVINADGTDLHVVTTFPTIVSSFIWSPDSTQILFGGRTGLAGDGLYEINASGAGMRLVTDLSSIPILYSTLSWSPKSKQVAFISIDESGTHEIAIINSDGSDFTVLTSAVDEHSPILWSPDGSQIVFMRPGKIFVMNADGSDEKQLSRGTTVDDEPLWSPDGASIAYLGVRLGQTEVYLMGADGSNPTQLTDNTLDESNLAWSPQDNVIAFSAYEHIGAEIYLTELSGNRTTNLATRIAASSPALWSPDGSKIAYVSNFDDLFVVDTEGNILSHLPHPDIVMIAWSPAGGDLMFVSDDIYLMRADGSNLRALGVNSLLYRFETAVWSPDGSKIAFSGRDAPSDCNADPVEVNYIFVIQADGTDLTKLTAERINSLAPTWSPDGSQIAYLQSYTIECDLLATTAAKVDAPEQILAIDLYVMDADGANPKRLAYDAFGPVWSPTTNQIAFERGAEIVVINADGTNESSLWPHIGGGNDPVWSPDGKRIAFMVGSDTAGMELFVTTLPDEP